MAQGGASTPLQQGGKGRKHIHTHPQPREHEAGGQGGCSRPLPGHSSSGEQGTTQASRLLSSAGAEPRLHRGLFGIHREFKTRQRQIPASQSPLVSLVRGGAGRSWQQPGCGHGLSTQGLVGQVRRSSRAPQPSQAPAHETARSLHPHPADRDAPSRAQRCWGRKRGSSTAAAAVLPLTSTQGSQSQSAYRWL